MKLIGSSSTYNCYNYHIQENQIPIRNLQILLAMELLLTIALLVVNAALFSLPLMQPGKTRKNHYQVRVSRLES